MHSAGTNNMTNPADIADIDAWIGIKHEQIRLRTVAQCAKYPLAIEHFGGRGGRGTQYVNWIQPGLLVHDEFELGRNTGQHARDTRIGTDQYRDAGAVYGEQVEAQDR